MQGWRLSEALTKQVSEMPPQLRKAALFVIAHPEDVALASMRKIARLAGVSHSTMMRLAAWLGYEDYETVRLEYVKDLRRGSGVAEGISRAEEDGASGAFSAAEHVRNFEKELASIKSRSGDSKHMKAARLLKGAGRIFAVGADSEFLLASHFARILTLRRRDVVLLDASDSSSKLDGRQIGSSDALLAISLAPHASSTTAIARHAKRHGVAVVAITDDAESKLGRLACCAVPVSRIGFPLAQSMTAAMAAVEVIATLMLDHNFG